MQSQPLPDRRPAAPGQPAQPTAVDRAIRVGSAAPGIPDRLFLALLASYRMSGGLARAAEVAAWIERDLGGDADQLRRWRVDRSVVCFDWQAMTWLPRFQFIRGARLPDLAVKAVLEELRSVFDEAQVAQWFAAPNAALADVAPVDCIGDDAPGVLRAARRDRCLGAAPDGPAADASHAGDSGQTGACGVGR